MGLFYHITFRIYQVGMKSGLLKKFDPFTLACNHMVIQGIYAVGLFGLLELQIQRSIEINEYLLSVIMAVVIIFSNYYFIKITGLEKLKHNFMKNGKNRKLIFDIIMVCYVVSAFLLINYVRTRKAI